MARRVNPDAQKLAMSGLIEAGIIAIAKEGIDQISVQSVSSAAGTSRPTFYSYFGDINGLLAEIWLAKADVWLEQLIDPAKAILKLSKKEQVLNRAMTEIFATAHRKPEVQELVEPKLRNWWKAQGLKTELAELKLAWFIGKRIGATLTDPIDPNVHQAAYVEPLLLQIPDNLSQKLPKPQLPGLSDPEIDSDDVDSKLLQSAIEVISTSGVGSASMARVARRAQVSTGAVYPRFSKVDNLIEMSFGVAVQRVIQQNLSFLESRYFSAEEYGNIVMAGLQPKRKVWRNFRVEIHLGARGRPKLTKRMAETLKATNSALANRLSDVPLPGLTEGPIPYLIHCIGIGLAVLQNNGIDVASLDHRKITYELVRLSREVAK